MSQNKDEFSKATDANPVESFSSDDLEKDFMERWKTNRFWVIRATYYIVISVWTIILVVGGFIAWLISFLFL